MTSPTIWAQTVDSLTIKTRLERQEKVRRQRDSLETIFNATPQIFKIALELNHSKTFCLWSVLSPNTKGAD